MKRRLLDIFAMLLVGDGILEDGVFDPLLNEWRMDAKGDPFLVGNGIGLLQADGVGEPIPIHLTGQRPAGSHFAFLHEIRDGIEFLEQRLRGEKDGKSIAAHFRIVRVEHTDAAGSVEAIHGPTGEDIDRSGVAAQAEQSGQIFFQKDLVVLFDLRLKGVLERLLDAGRGIDVRRHVDIMRAGTLAGLKDRVVRVTIAGIQRHGDLVLGHRGGDFGRLHGIERDHLEPAALGRIVQHLCVGGIDVGQDDFVEAFVLVELPSDDGADSTHSDNHDIGHKKGAASVRHISS